MAVRSKRLFGPTSVGTSGGLLYTSPVGETTLIKHLEVGPGALGGMTASFYLGAIATGNQIHQLTLNSGEWGTLLGFFWVLQPGEELRCQTSASTVRVTGFGAQLEGVAD